MLTAKLSYTDNYLFLVAVLFFKITLHNTGSLTHHHPQSSVSLMGRHCKATAIKASSLIAFKESDI